MKRNVTYGQCLSDILEAYDLKCSKLAREINIDSSLIYKWLRNERVPPYDSPYIELIINCLSKREINIHQRKALIEVLNDNEIEVFEPNDTLILKHLKSILQNAQAYSIKLHDKLKNNRRGYQKDKHSICDSVQVFRGSTDVLHAAVSLLDQALKIPLPSRDSIIVTIDSELKLLLLEKSLSRQFFLKLHELQNKGWKLIMEIKLDHNIDRIIKIIEDIQMLLSGGNLSIYYLDKLGNNPVMGNELIVVPELGALLGFSAFTKGVIDSAFLFRSKNSMDLLSAQFFQSINYAKPLIKTYPSQMSMEFHQVFAESERMPGDKYVFKGGLSTTTIPLDLYEKYLNDSGMMNQELSNRISLHKRRLNAFEDLVPHYKYLDICFTESILDLVNKKTYPFDEKYLTLNYTPNNSDIVRHLENVISMLERYDNYNIAFVSKTQFKKMHRINWMIKGSYCVMIEVFDQNSIDYFNSKTNFSITETRIVNTFHDYFNILWDSIPEKGKDKYRTILWVKSLIKKLLIQTDE